MGQFTPLQRGHVPPNLRLCPNLISVMHFLVECFAMWSHVFVVHSLSESAISEAQWNKYQQNNEEVYWFSCHLLGFLWSWSPLTSTKGVPSASGLIVRQLQWIQEKLGERERQRVESLLCRTMKMVILHNLYWAVTWPRMGYWFSCKSTLCWEQHFYVSIRAVVLA